MSGPGPLDPKIVFEPHIEQKYEVEGECIESEILYKEILSPYSSVVLGSLP